VKKFTVAKTANFQQPREEQISFGEKIAFLIYLECTVCVCWGGVGGEIVSKNLTALRSPPKKFDLNKIILRLTSMGW
jgi:hypothetical protein